MIKKSFFTSDETYVSPSLREVKASIESGFAASSNFNADDLEDGQSDWLN